MCRVLIYNVQYLLMRNQTHKNACNYIIALSYSTDACVVVHVHRHISITLVIELG